MSVQARKLPASSTAGDIAAVLGTDGVAIVEDFFTQDLVSRLNAELDPYVGASRPRVQAHVYDAFLGADTVRLQALCAKSESFAEALIDARILEVMDRVLRPNCTDYRLSAAELIEIRGGETAQPIHRDDDSWPRTNGPASPLVVNVMIALTDFTRENGATIVVPGSQAWDLSRKPTPEECTQAVMTPGSVAIFTGNCLHAGGTNTSGVPRRGISVAYCHGWLMPVENSWLGIPLEVASGLPGRARELLGFELYDGTPMGGGMINMYEVGNPRVLVDS